MKSMCVFYLFSQRVCLIETQNMNTTSDITTGFTTPVVVLGTFIGLIFLLVVLYSVCKPPKKELTAKQKVQEKKRLIKIVDSL